MGTVVTATQWGRWCADCIAGGRYHSKELAVDAATQHENECHGADS